MNLFMWLLEQIDAVDDGPGQNLTSDTTYLIIHLANVVLTLAQHKICLDHAHELTDWEESNEYYPPYAR